MQSSTHSILRTLTLSIVAFLAGCVAPTWTTVPGPYHAEKIGVTADMPEGWSRFGPGKDIMLTKDGFLLNFIQISRTPYGEKYENTELTIKQGMTELDASQIVLDAMQANQERRNLAILDNRPVTVAGSPGFRLEVTFENEDNLIVHETLYVVLTPGGYLVAMARSPERYYAEMMNGTFEQVVASIQVDPPEPAQAKKKG